MRKYLVITLIVITVLSFLVWGFSKFIQPVLPPDINYDLVLFFAALIGVITILTGIPDIYKRIVKLFSGHRRNTLESFTEKQNQRNREIMLARVWDAWIEGVLKKSLYSEVRFELGLELQPEALGNPWDSVLQMPEQAPIRIPTYKKILDVFNESGKSLVILGEPGSGKTTELLELASQAIECAKKNPEQHITVVFNLSTWTPKQNIQDWLVNEFWERYKISPKLGRYWVSKNELMLLLDGLDEVKNEYRNQCVQAINEFLKEHLSSIAICCRKNEFETLATRINVHSIILIQPLSSEQVVDYLQIAGPELVAIYYKLKTDSDSESQDFIHTPLMLSILILAYQDASAQEIESLVKSTDYRKHLLDFYINHMFKRRRKSHIYTDVQTKNWLTWLASRMIENGLSLFYIEYIQSNWLESARQRQYYKLLKMVFIMLIFGLIGGLSFGLSVGLIGGLTGGLICGPIVGLGVRAREYKKPVYKLEWSWSRFKGNLVFGLIFGLIVGMIFEMVGRLSLGLIFGLIYGLSCVLILGLFNIGEIEIHDKPDQSLRNSLINYLIGVMSVGLGAGLIGWLIGGLSVGLGLGLIVGPMFGLGYGGGFLISHFLLRWQLYRANKIPFRLINFLDFAAERVFLRKVGGGYIFIHRMVMEHFAEMEA